MTLIFKYFISLTIIVTTNYLFAQSSVDKLTNNYAENLLGTWVRQNEVIDGRGSQTDTTVFSYDTLRFAINKNYYNCQGANFERKWTGIIDSGTWVLNSLKDSSIIIFYQKYSNLPLPLTSYSYTITELTETELRFSYYNRIFIYRKNE